MPEEPLVRSIRALALNLLGRRDYSRFQLSEKLQQKVENRRQRFPAGNVPEAIRYVVRSLETSGLMDDARFAGSVARRGRTGRLFGDVRIRRDLKRFGIDAKIADSALAHLPDESEALDKIVEHYVRRRGEPASLRELQILYRYGVRLGHRPSEVRKRLGTYFRKLRK